EEVSRERALNQLQAASSKQNNIDMADSFKDLIAWQKGMALAKVVYLKLCITCLELAAPQAACDSSVKASTASSNRSREPVFAKMLCRWRLTVFSLMFNCAAMSRFFRPRATRKAICFSRSLSRCSDAASSRVSEAMVPSTR